MRGIRFLLILGSAVMAGLAGGATSPWLFSDQPAYADKPAGTPKVIAAEKFTLVDQGGHEHASLQIGTDGNPALVLYDVDHNVRFILELMAAGNPRLFLSDQEGKIRFALGTSVDGEPFLHLKNADRKIIWSAP